MPLYNSSEVFVPSKQYGNTIHSDSLDIKKTERDALLYLCLLLITSSSEVSLFKQFISMVKTLWFIYINAVFAPHIDCVCSYSKK